MASGEDDSMEILDDLSDPATDEESDDGSLFTPVMEHDTWTETTLCAHCRSICDILARGSEEDFHTPALMFPHWSSCSDIEASITGRCSMCAQFLESAPKEDSNMFMSALRDGNMTYCKAFVTVSGNRLPECLELDMTLCYFRSFDPTINQSHSPDCERIMFQAILIRCDTDVSSSPYHRQGSTASTLPLISRWLQICQRTHWQCRHLSGDYLPTRLLSTDTDRVRLLLRHEVPTSSNYATLSHCWGKERFQMLSKRNIHAFRQRIPETALSRTYKDAIIVARSLGIPYIWIDSMCIVQDDDRDWDQEAATMSAVYGGSSLNIAATAAPDGIFGCFAQSELQHCLIKLKLGDALDIYRCVPYPLYGRFLTNMPLMRRAWALQERLLPSRTVHFSSPQVFWECHQKVACESFPEQLPSILTHERVFFNKQPLSRSMWNWIVQHYSGSELTHSSDALVAISGVVRAIQSQTQDQYVAGMWRRDLEYQLCWQKVGPGRPMRVTPYRAPSWSWASLDCKIEWPFWDASPFKQQSPLRIRVLDVTCVPAGSDPLGKLRSATLRLGCRCVVHVKFRHDPAQEFIPLGSYIQTAHGSIRVRINLDEGDENLLCEAIVVPIDDGKIGGLLLEATRRRRGQYRRLGVYNFTVPQLGEAFDTACEDSSTWVPESQLVKIRKDKFGVTQRIITLV